MMPGSPFSYRYCLYLLVILTAFTRISAAETTTRFEADIATGLNPQSFGMSASGYLRQTYHHSDSPLWDGLYLQAGAQTVINPAFVRGGLHLEWLPVAPLQLRMQYDRFRFSGNYGSLMGFSSAEESFSDAALKRRSGEEQKDYGKRTLLQITLRAPLGRYLLLNRSGYHHYQFPDDAPFYLEREHEILLAADDHLLTNRLTLLYRLTGKTDAVSNLVGPFHEYYLGDRSGLEQEKVGLFCYRESATNLGALEKPRAYLQLGYYLQERNREAQFTLMLGIGADLAI